MIVESVRKHYRVQITANEMPIDAHWNFFEDTKEAIKHLATLTKLPNVTYGFLETKMELWAIK